MFRCRLDDKPARSLRCFSHSCQSLPSQLLRQRHKHLFVCATNNSDIREFLRLPGRGGSGMATIPDSRGTAWAQHISIVIMSLCTRIKPRAITLTHKIVLRRIELRRETVCVIALFPIINIPIKLFMQKKRQQATTYGSTIFCQCRVDNRVRTCTRTNLGDFCSPEHND